MAKIAGNHDILDDFDRRILSEVQQNANRTNAEIGNVVGLSASAVRRRLQRLKKHGIIQAIVGTVDPDQFGVTLIVDLCFSAETPELYDAFDEQIRGLDAVQQSYHVAGDTDYVLVIHGPSVQWYENWSKQVLMSNPHIKRYSSRVVWSRKKFEPAVMFESRFNAER